VLGTAGGGDDGGVQRSQPEQMLLRGLATPLLRDSGSVTDGPPGHLLTVREAARLLRVSTGRSTSSARGGSWCTCGC
jgi:hypothetical protein